MEVSKSSLTQQHNPTTMQTQDGTISIPTSHVTETTLPSETHIVTGVDQITGTHLTTVPESLVTTSGIQQTETVYVSSELLSPLQSQVQTTTSEVSNTTVVDGVTYELIKNNTAPKSLLTGQPDSMDVQLIPVVDHVGLQEMAVETKSNEKDKDVNKTENVVESSEKPQLVQHVLVPDPNNQVPATLINTGEKTSISNKPTVFVTTPGNINLSMNSAYLTADDKSDCVYIQIGDKTYSSKIENETPVIEEALIQETYFQLGHNVLKEGDNVDLDKMILQTLVDLSETEGQNSLPMEIIKAESIGEYKNDIDGINKVPTESSPYYVIQQVTEGVPDDDNQEKEFLSMEHLKAYIKSGDSTAIVSLPNNQQNIYRPMDSVARNAADEPLVTNTQGIEVTMMDFNSIASIDTETTPNSNKLSVTTLACVSDKEKETGQQTEKSTVPDEALIRITNSPDVATTATTSPSTAGNLQNASNFRDVGQHTEKIKSTWQQQTAVTVTVATTQQSQPAPISRAITQSDQIESQQLQVKQLQENQQPFQPINQSSPFKSSIKSSVALQAKIQQASPSKQSQPPSQLQKGPAKTVMTTNTTTATGTARTTTKTNEQTSLKDKSVEKSHSEPPKKSTEEDKSPKTPQIPQFVEVETVLESSYKRSVQTQTDPQLRKRKFSPLGQEGEIAEIDPDDLVIFRGCYRKNEDSDFGQFEGVPKRKSAKRNTKEALKCPFCYKSFIGLVKHIKSKHRDEPDYDEEMHNAKWRERIMKFSTQGGEEEGEKYLECGKVTKNMKEHQELHQQNRMQSACPICGKVVLRTGISSHMRTVHSGRKPYKCPHCDYSSAFHGNLKTHIKGMHLHTRQYLCDVCKAAFKTLGTLIGHTKRVHEGWKSANQIIFICSVCEKRFTTKYHVDRHMLIHTGEKPHKCTDCGRGFNNKSNLMSHIQLIHKKLTPYQCDMCQETFKRKKLLLEHIGKVHVATGEMAPLINDEDEDDEYEDIEDALQKGSVATELVESPAVYATVTDGSMPEGTYTAVVTDGTHDLTNQTITVLQTEGGQEIIINIQAANPEEVAHAIIEQGDGTVQYETTEQTITGTIAAELFSQMQS